MGKCWRCRGKGQVETSPAAWETCHQCGGTGSDKKPKCEHCGRTKFYDPNGIYGWVCAKCDQHDTLTPFSGLTESDMEE